jgi:diacylglycerol kinase
MWKSLLRPFNYAFRGLSVVWREERNFRIQTFCAAVATIFMAWFEFSAIECIVTIFAIVLVLTAEIINTAIEDLCNRIEPNHDPLI